MEKLNRFKTLEELGWRFVYACIDVNDPDYGMVVFDKDDNYIIRDTQNNWMKHNKYYLKLSFTEEEILAIGEYIKHEQNRK